MGSLLVRDSTLAEAFTQQFGDEPAALFKAVATVSTGNDIKMAVLRARLSPTPEQTTLLKRAAARSATTMIPFALRQADRRSPEGP